MTEAADMETPLELLVDQVLGRDSRDRFSSILAPLTQDLRDVSARISEVIPCTYPFLTEAASYAMPSGGKHLRPLVILVTYRALGFSDTTKVHSLAAAFQLIHTASLVHDDVIDHAELRRGRPSIPKAFGSPAAIVAGDYLFVRAFQLAATYSPEIIVKCGNASADLAQGEIMQENTRYDLTVGKERYLRIVTYKTANAIGAGAEAAAMVAGVSDESRRSLAHYGRALGIAFQMKDDILDIYGDPEVTGKPLYSDLREGLPTLPTIMAYERISGREREEFERLFTLRNKRQVHLLRLREICDSAGVKRSSEEEAERWSLSAISALKNLPQGSYRDLLEKLASGATNRRL